MRDGLGLPTRLRDLEAVPQEEFPTIARHVLDNHNTENAPASLNPTAEEIQAVLREAW